MRAVAAGAVDGRRRRVRELARGLRRREPRRDPAHARGRARGRAGAARVVRAAARARRRGAAARRRQPPVRARPVRALPARAPARGGRGGQHRRRRARAGLRGAGRAPARWRRSRRRRSTACASSARGWRTRPARSTRFVVLRSRCPAPTGRDRSFFVVTPRRDEPGSLVRLLQEFSVRGINLTTIESRPTRALLGEYRFLIECEGHVADAHVRDAVLGLLRFPGDDALPRLLPRGPRAPRPRARARAPPEAVRGLRADAGAGRGVKDGRRRARADRRLAAARARRRGLRRRPRRARGRRRRGLRGRGLARRPARAASSCWWRCRRPAPRRWWGRCSTRCRTRSSPTPPR